ncbi:MAG: extracellular solute-binding protein [Pararoseburia sp.]|nr:extracellular solute-binding protein [Pararoseburia sp.]
MKKKIVSLLLVGVLAMSAFVGCGKSSGNSAKSDDSANTEENTAAKMYTSDDENTLTVAAWDANFNIPALKAAEKAFQKENPDFKLEIIEQSQSSDIENAITTAAQSGNYENLPDIVLFQDHYIQQYVTNYPDAWQDIDDADIDWSDFGEEKLSFSTIDGKHYGAPVDNGTVIFAYRVDLLEQCGYTLDDVTGITWDKFIEIGEKVYNETGKYLLSMDGSGNDLPYMMLQAEGVSQFKDGKANIADNKTMTQIIEVIEKMQQKNVLLLANDWSGYTNDIQKDKVAGVMNGNWIIPTIEQVAENSGKWEITSMPTLSGEEGYASNGGSSLYVTANCKKTDLAKKFLAYTFGGGDGAIDTYDNALRDGGVITTCISAGKSDVYQEGVEYFNNQAIYAKIVEMGSHVKVVEQSDYHYTAREKVAAAITNIHNGTSVEDALAQAQQDLEFAMEE